MIGDFPLIRTKQYETMASAWLEAIRREENASVMFVPKADRHIRIGQFMGDNELHKKILKEKRVECLRLNFDVHDVEDRDDLLFQIQESLMVQKLTKIKVNFDEYIQNNKKEGIVLVIIIPEAEKFLDTAHKHILQILSDLVDSYSPWISIFSFFEADITHPSVLPLLPASGRLYENLFHFPLYSEPETADFMHLLMKQWNLTIKPKEIADIFEKCGGHFWLVKEAIRRISSDGSWSTEHSGMQFRLRTVYSLMSFSEQSALRKLVLNDATFSSEEKLSLDFLMRMKILNENKNFLVGGFKDYLLYTQDLTQKLSVKEGRILLNKVPIDEMFSRQEARVLRNLLQHENIVVSRDQIAKSIWSDSQEEYSDWAIDQLIARIRRRLKQLSINPKALSVVRGKGYILRT